MQKTFVIPLENDNASIKLLFEENLEGIWTCTMSDEAMSDLENYSNTGNYKLSKTKSLKVERILKDSVVVYKVNKEQNVNKPKSKFVMLRGPAKAKKPDGTDSERLHISVVRNDDKLDITGYEFTKMINDEMEMWTVVENKSLKIEQKMKSKNKKFTELLNDYFDARIMHYHFTNSPGAPTIDQVNRLLDNIKSSEIAITEWLSNKNIG